MAGMTGKLSDAVEREILARCRAEVLHNWLGEVFRTKELDRKSWRIVVELLAQLQRRTKGPSVPAHAENKRTVNA